MLSLMQYLLKLFSFCFLVVSFSLCILSCECEEDSIPCAGKEEEYLHLITPFEFDTLSFIGTDSSIIQLVCGKIEAVIRKEVDCFYKSGACHCGDCHSEYSVSLDTIDTNGRRQIGSIEIEFRQYAASTSKNPILSEVSAVLIFNLNFVYGAIDLPLPGKSVDDRHEFFEVFEVNGKDFNKVYRIYQTSRNNGDSLEETSGSVLYSEEDGLVGFTTRNSEMQYIKIN